MKATFPYPLQLCVSSAQLVKLCSGMIEAGKAYVSANKIFVNGIRDLSQQCKKDEMISVRFWWISVWTITAFIVVLLSLYVIFFCHLVDRIVIVMCLQGWGLSSCLCVSLTCLCVWVNLITNRLVSEDQIRPGNLLLAAVAAASPQLWTSFIAADIKYY